jgi:exodeoxyribonuclease VII small subunit
MSPEPERPAGASGSEDLTYEAATGRLEEIIRRLDSGEAGLRETLDLCQEGRSLVEFCTVELEEVGRGLEELRLEELVARLESSGRAAEGGPGDRGAGESGQGASVP